MPILPLPQFEADMEADRKVYEALQPPKSMVVRFGVMKLIGEYPHDGNAKPGCGSKLVARTHRGTEIVELLTSTCPNGGCGHAVTRKDMLGYIDNSGGKDYPFFTEGRILRVATMEDMNRQAAMDAKKPAMVKKAREIVERLELSNKMKMVEVEPLLGDERLTFYFYGEERVDFRPVVMELAAIYHTRIEMRQIGARDEARLVADYEKCGQHCCCKQFLKVLKPVSMKQAKIQKATLDPLKISGRCGRLMCCLRYEENTYDELKKNLPRKKTQVMTPDGPGLVVDTQILTQLVMVRLDRTDENAAYPVETLKRIDPNAPQQGGGDDDDDGPQGQQQQGQQRPYQQPRGNQGGGGGGGGGGGPRPQGGGQQQQRPSQGQSGGYQGGQGGQGGGAQQGNRSSQGSNQHQGRPQQGQGQGSYQGGGQNRSPQQGQQHGGQQGHPQGQRPNQPPRREDVNERDRRRASGLVPPSDFRQQNPAGQNPNQPTAGQGPGGSQNPPPPPSTPSSPSASAQTPPTPPSPRTDDSGSAPSQG